MKLLIVTACQAGVAHSKMTEAALRKEAERRGHQVISEIQGGYNLTNALSEKECQSADVVLIANAVAIAGKERFRGKLTITVPIDKAIRNVSLVINKVDEVYRQHS